MLRCNTFCEVFASNESVLDLLTFSSCQCLGGLCIDMHEGRGRSESNTVTFHGGLFFFRFLNFYPFSGEGRKEGKEEGRKEGKEGRKQASKQGRKEEINLRLHKP